MIGTSYRRSEGNSNMHMLLWWPGKSLPWLWEGSLRPSSLYCLPECACQRDPLPCQTQGPPICTDGLRGHPVLHWISPAHAGSESQWSHTNEGHFFSVASLCKSSNDWFTLFSKCIAHSIAFSHILVSWYPRERFGHLIGSAASSVSHHVPSPHETGEENTWQSSSKPYHHGQSSKTRTGRHRKHRAPGWSGGWLRPLNPSW